jgi:hypothetical protein
MEFAQDATWWFSPLHRMSPNKGVFYRSVFQQWISLIGGKKDLDLYKILKFNVVIVIMDCIDG